MTSARTPPPVQEKGIISKDELELMYQLVEIVQSKSVAAQATLIEMRSAEHAQLFKALLTGVKSADEPLRSAALEAWRRRGGGVVWRR